MIIFMKNRPFILLELLIALALVALFSLPLVRSHAFHFNKKKEQLLSLEKERKAEELFYEICKILTKNHPLDKVTAAYKKNLFMLKSNTVTLDLGPLKKQTYYWHYHLWSYKAPQRTTRKLYCKICLFPRPTGVCQKVKKLANADYGFYLTIKKPSKT